MFGLKKCKSGPVASVALCDPGKCYGGLARLARAVGNIRESEPSTLWLNAGDFYQGTVWYTQFKWRVISLFSNILDFDAMTLGNHEFDDNIAGIAPFLANQSSPVVVTNLNTSKVPELSGLVVPSVVLEVNGRRVGIVGYLTPLTAHISDPGPDLVFTDEVAALTSETERLAEAGVEVILALGHSGYTRDLEIAKAVPLLDVIVGGHSHSLLVPAGRAAPSKEEVRGSYPSLVTERPGTAHPALVVQAYAYTKYLGRLDLQFSDGGEVVGWSGGPVLLDSSFPPDPVIQQALQPWQAQLAELTNTVLGTAGEPLLIARDRETNLGNLVADSMVQAWENASLPGYSR